MSLNQKENYIALSVNEKYMKEKKCDYLAMAIADSAFFQIDSENNNKRYINETQFKRELRSKMNLSYAKVNTIIKVFEDLGFVERKNGNLYLDLAEPPYVTLSLETTQYCINFLSSLTFKIYCYLLSKYNDHLIMVRQAKGRYVENFYFSKTQLGNVCGFCGRNEYSIHLMEEGLQTLEQLGLIKYNHKMVPRPTGNGLYHELLWVSEVSVPQIEALRDKEVQELGEDELGISLEEQNQKIKYLESLNPIYNDKTLEEEDVKKLEEENKKEKSKYPYIEQYMLWYNGQTIDLREYTIAELEEIKKNYKGKDGQRITYTIKIKKQKRNGIEIDLNMSKGYDCSDNVY